MTVRPTLGGGLVLLLLAGTLVLPYPGGYPLAYLLIVASLLLAVWLFAAGIPPRPGPAGWMLLAALALLGTAFAVTGELALLVNFLMFAVFWPLAAALARFARPGNARQVGVLALLGAVLAVGIALWEVRVAGHDRAAGMGSDPIWSAQIALVLGFLALVAVPVTTGPWRLVFWLGPICGTITVLLSGSRGPLLAVPILFLVAVPLLVKRWWLALPLIAVAGIGLVAIIGLVHPASLERLATLPTIAGQLANGVGPSEVSSSRREAFYAGALSAFLAEPLFGYGWSNTVSAIMPWLDERAVIVAEGHHHLHSDILDFAIAAGLFGLGAYALVIAAPVAGALAAPRDGQYRARLTGSVLLALGYLVCGLTYLMFGYEFHTTLYVCLAAILLGYCRDEPPR